VGGLTILLLGFDALRARAREWNDVVSSSPRPSPFMLAEYVDAWWAAMALPGEVPLLVAAELAGALVAVVPLYVRRDKGLRVVGMIGDHEAAPSDLCLSPQAGPDVAAAVVEAVRAHGGYDFARLGGLDAVGTLARPEHGLHAVERIAGPIIELDAPWSEEAERRLSRDVRKAHRRRLRRLAEVGEVTIEVRRDVPALEEALAVHRKRWPVDEDGSTFANEAGRSLHRRVMRSLGPQGVARLAMVRVDGTAIGFQYYFVVGTTAFCFRIGHDPDYATYAPGTAALFAALEDATADGVRRVELLGGGEAYKLGLADATRPMSWGSGWARTPAGVAAAAADRAVLRAHIALRESRLAGVEHRVLRVLGR
jgi:CelD/BcsL family acetyltransferase involved in cellulose biosynthesis